MLMKTRPPPVAQPLCSFSLASHLLDQSFSLSLLYSGCSASSWTYRSDSLALKDFCPAHHKFNFWNPEMGFDNCLLAPCTKHMGKRHYIFRSRVANPGSLLHVPTWLLIPSKEGRTQSGGRPCTPQFCEEKIKTRARTSRQ